MKLTSWINLGRRGARAELSTLDTAHNPPPPPYNSPERAIPRPTRTHIPHRNHQQPPQDRKSDPKWQSQTMSKTETTSKALLKPTNRPNPRRRGARTKPSTPWHRPQAPPLPPHPGKSQRRNPRRERIFGTRKPFKNDKQCALFHPKYSLCSQETVSPVSILWSCTKMAWLER